MKLAELARKASKLPDIDFEWPGPEQFSDYNFQEATKTHDDLVKYVDGLRQKMASYSMALHDLAGAYRQMRDLMLEAEVEDGHSR